MTTPAHSWELSVLRQGARRSRAREGPARSAACAAGGRASVWWSVRLTPHRHRRARPPGCAPFVPDRSAHHGHARRVVGARAAPGPADQARG